MFRVRDGRGRASTTSSTARRLAAPVLLDRDAWEKVVLNLLSNALKFTFAGRVSVRVRGRPPTPRCCTVERHRRRGARRRAAAPVRALPPRRGPRRALRRGQRHRPGAGARARRRCTAARSRATSDARRGHHDDGHAPVRAGAPAARAGRGADAGHRAGTAEPLEPSPDAESFVAEALRWLPDDPESTDAEPPTPETPAGLAAPVAERTRGRVLVADDNADMRAYLRRLLAPAPRRAADRATARRRCRRRSPTRRTSSSPT